MRLTCLTIVGALIAGTASCSSEQTNPSATGGKSGSIDGGGTWATGAKGGVDGGGGTVSSGGSAGSAGLGGNSGGVAGSSATGGVAGSSATGGVAGTTATGGSGAVAASGGVAGSSGTGASGGTSGSGGTGAVAGGTGGTGGVVATCTSNNCSFGQYKCLNDSCQMVVMKKCDDGLGCPVDYPLMIGNVLDSGECKACLAGGNELVCSKTGFSWSPLQNAVCGAGYYSAIAVTACSDGPHYLRTQK